jgi:hypothetical protein
MRLGLAPEVIILLIEVNQRSRGCVNLNEKIEPAKYGCRWGRLLAQNVRPMVTMD